MNIYEHIVELVDISMANPAGVRLFEQLNFSLKPGQAAVLVGSTGDGKTSLVRLLIGNIKPDSGTVLVFGEKINRIRERRINRIRRQIGGVGGIFRPISYQTVFENMSHPLILNGVKSGLRKKKIRMVLDQFYLAGRIWSRASQLSQGEKILLMLARAVVANQPLLLIDEPLAGLSPEMFERVSAGLVKLSLAGHSMIILTSGTTVPKLPNAEEYSLKSGRLQ